ncbi:hypothetical protein A9Q82_04355 [Cycloclasticus sp. 46_120_T64]|nr:hypothetical protein A9Q82_04355 [Cycloclasticus sp. 46_120_T64]
MQTKLKHLAFTLCLISITFIAYMPGISGPFLFDDITSITTNSKLQINKLSYQELSNATLSGYAGPLKRPVAMLSFALNYYFSAGYITANFKITNIVIHCINAILVYLLSLQLFKRNSIINRNSSKLSSVFGLAAAASLLWALHPINLTSVLYIVQRMTSLSTLFSLGSIILYLAARNHWLQKKTTWPAASLVLTSLCSLALALFSKENAILIPLIIILIELTLYSDSKPWSLLKTSSKPQQLIIWSIIAVFSILSLLASINYAEGGFNSRPFSMLERLLTESRVLCLYLSLILIPRINGFGLFHDDIALSSSLFSPWTTLSSTAFILALLAIAFYYHKKNPLFSLGIGWFFIGHLLESTIFPLEIAHEHRNNLPSIGILLAALSLLPAITEINKKKLTLAVIFIAVIFGSTTFLRSSQWKSAYSQALHEVVHHPESSAAQVVFSNVAHKTGHIKAATTAIKKAILLDPNEIALYMYYQHILASTNQTINASIQEKTLQIIKDHRATPSAQLALSQLSNCLSFDSCAPLRKNYLAWTNALIKKKPNMGYYYLFKGKAHLALGDEIKALNVFQNAFDMDNRFLHPLFEMADILIKQADVENSARIINWLKEANKKAPISRDKEITQLQENYALMLNQLYNKETNDSQLHPTPQPP